MLAKAQTVTGSISGTVRDTSGALIPNATVKLTQTATGVSREGVTNDKGDFIFSAVVNGEYTLMVKANGFKNAERRGIALSSAEYLAVGEITLEVGGVGETVTITAQTEQVQTASAERSGTITSDQVDNLPILGRNVKSLAALLPGVVETSDDEGLTRSYNLNVQGNRTNTNSVSLDGVTLNALGNNNNGVVTVSQDAVAEVKVQLSNYQAEYGRMSGANITIITKSGTRQFHGGGSYFKRHEQFNANNFFSNQPGLQRPRYRYNVWNYNFGGPVVVPGTGFNKGRDKLFFFFNQEWWPLEVPQAIRQATVPTALERQGNFSQTTEQRQAVPSRDDVPRSFIDSRGVHFGPRFGFAYDLTGKGQMAVRGGFGWFYNRQNLDTIINQYSTQPPLVRTPVVQFGSFSTLLSTTGLNQPQAVLGLDGIGKIPTVMNFSLSVQRSLGFKTILDVGYAGSLGRHLMWQRDINSIPLGANFDPANRDTSQTTNTPLPANFLRPVKGYAAINIREFASSSNYHSLQVQLNRRMSKSLQFGGAWTWSKSLNYNSADGNNVTTLAPIRVWNYGLSDFDRTHVVKINYLWSLPSPRWKNPFAEYVLNGWQVSGITSFVSGVPAPTQLRGPGVNNHDIAFFKSFRFVEKLNLQFRGELYNAFNHTQFSAFDTAARFDAAGAQINARLGEFTAARRARVMQFALKLQF